MAKNEKNASFDSAVKAELLTLKRLLLAGATMIALVTLFEWSNDLITPWNRWLEPTVAILFTVLAYTLRRWTQFAGQVRVAAVATFNLYVVSNTLALLFWAPQPLDQYQFLTTVYWLPFGYGSAFLFLSIHYALAISLIVFLTVSLPVWTTLWMMGNTHWGAGFPAVAALLGLAQLMYIALWTAVAMLRAGYYRAEERTRLLESLAFSDPLTSLPNRRALANQMEVDIEAAHLQGDTLSAAMIDIDHFKFINDTFGHQSGDEVLKKIGPLLLENLHMAHSIGRWGGEEFLVVCTATCEDTCVEIAERLRSAVEACEFPHRERVTISIGVAALRGNESLAEFVERADHALYRAKSLGRNRVELAE